MLAEKFATDRYSVYLKTTAHRRMIGKDCGSFTRIYCCQHFESTLEAWF